MFSRTPKSAGEFNAIEQGAAVFAFSVLDGAWNAYKFRFKSLTGCPHDCISVPSHIDETKMGRQFVI